MTLSTSVFMGPMELPSQSAEVIKIPTSHYEFGANFLDPKVHNLAIFFINLLKVFMSNQSIEVLFLIICIFFTFQKMLVGRIMTDGRLNLRIKYDLTDELVFKLNGSVCDQFLT